MSIMCSTVTTTGVVTFELDVAPNGRSIYRVCWWNGKKWSEARYKSFNAARKTFNLISRMV